MTRYYLENWKQYLMENDFQYLIQYIDNIKNNISNDKMIILVGPSKSGKSTLLNDISTSLGYELCDVSIMSGDIIHNEDIKKLIFFPELVKNKRTITSIINFIKYKQCFITATDSMKNIDSRLLEYSRIINMEHIFII